MDKHERSSRGPQKEEEFVPDPSSLPEILAMTIPVEEQRVVKNHFS